MKTRVWWVGFACGGMLSAFTPKLHGVQTQMAQGLIPKAMQGLLKRHEAFLLQGLRDFPGDSAPTAAEVGKQFQRVVEVSEAKKPMGQIVRELGLLASMVQLLMDPSLPSQTTQDGRDALLRKFFRAYGDEKLSKLLLTQEPLWAIASPLTPHEPLLQREKEQKERHQRLLAFVNLQKGTTQGAWDNLSIPFAQLQLSFSGGVYATANLWILAYRAAGELWEFPTT